MLSFEHVSKFLISDMTIHIPKGVSVGVIGASGAGKTTFLKLACGVLKAEQGAVYTFQKDPVEDKSLLKPRVGFLLERMPVFDGSRSLEDNFRDLKIIYRLSDMEFKKAYDSLAKRFGIEELEQVQVKELSFGQRRRAELAAVLLHRPELLLLDEPTNGLDEIAKRQLQEILKERVREGMTVVMTSHDMREISGTCQRIIVLEQGKLLYYGEEAVLLRQYAPMDTMRLRIEGNLPDIDDLPVLKYEIRGEELCLVYNSNHITASEVLELIVRQTSVREISIQKPNLSDVIFAIKESVQDTRLEEKGEKQNEFH